MQLIAIVKADGYGHGMLEAAQAAREGGAEWIGVATLDEALALRDGGDTGRLLCWLTVPGEDYAAGIAADIDLTAYSVAELDEIAAAGGPARVQLKLDTGLSRGGAPRDQWADLFARAKAGETAGSWQITGVWSHFACSDEPDHPANDAQEAAFTEALAMADAAGLHPEIRHLANSAAAILRPSSRFDAVRCGIAIYGLDPAPGVTDDIGLVPAMTARARLALVKQIEAGDSVGYGHTWTADHATTVGLVPDRVWRRGAPPCEQHRRGDRRRQAPPHQGPREHGPDRGRPRRRRRRARRRGGAVRHRRRRRADRPGLGRGLRHHQLRDRDPDRRTDAPQLRRQRGQRMTARRRVAGAVAGALGVAAAGTAIGIVRQQRAIDRRAGEDIEFGALRSTPLTVVADDGVDLHVEVDEVEPTDGGIKRRLAKVLDEPEVTVVFAHGFCLNLDCWHFQRAAYRGLVRTVYYDQRSHGRSSHSDREHSNIDQLAQRPQARASTPWSPTATWSWSGTRWAA